MKIAVSGRDTWQERVGDAVAFLGEIASCGVSLCYDSDLMSAFRRAGVEVPAGEVFTCWKDLPSDTGLFLALGGDGTFLSAMEYVRDSGIPVAGVNFGRLGFLTACTAGAESARRLAGGLYSVQNRSLLRLDAEGLPAGFWPYALNEISLQRRGAGLLSLEISVDGKPLPTYWADGILIATPTGSTAYSLSLGGPIVTPECSTMLITPVASHNLNQRPLVIPLSSKVEIRASGRSDIAIAADNRSFDLPLSVRAAVSQGEFPLRYVSFTDDSFITALRSKLLWGEDGRNFICQ